VPVAVCFPAKADIGRERGGNGLRLESRAVPAGAAKPKLPVGLSVDGGASRAQSLRSLATSSPMSQVLARAVSAEPRRRTQKRSACRPRYSSTDPSAQGLRTGSRLHGSRGRSRWDKSLTGRSSRLRPTSEGCSPRCLEGSTGCDWGRRRHSGRCSCWLSNCRQRWRWNNCCVADQGDRCVRNIAGGVYDGLAATPAS